jgi:hypothetical protein
LPLLRRPRSGPFRSHARLHRPFEIGLQHDVTSGRNAVFAGTSAFGPVYAAYGFTACAFAAVVLTLVSALASNGSRAASA